MPYYAVTTVYANVVDSISIFDNEDDAKADFMITVQDLAKAAGEDIVPSLNNILKTGIYVTNQWAINLVSNIQVKDKRGA